MNNLNKFYLLLFLIPFTSCTENLLSSVSSKNSDEYYLEEAIKSNNAQQFDDAISYITEQMSSEGQQATKAKEVLASAYAGKCGLNFLNYTEAFSGFTSGSVFYNMMQPFIGIDVDPDSCVTALHTIDTIGSASDRTSSQNTFAAIAGMALMGSGMRGYIDTTPSSSYGDGTADVNICDASSGLPDDQLNNIAIGFSYFVENIGAISEDLIGSSLTTLQSLTTDCQTLNGGTPCVGKTQADVASAFRIFLRNYLITSKYGVGSYSIVNTNTSTEDTACLACGCPADATIDTACSVAGCQ